MREGLREGQREARTEVRVCDGDILPHPRPVGAWRVADGEANVIRGGDGRLVVDIVDLERDGCCREKRGGG